MPLYEWRCPACDLIFEALAGINAARRKRRCPRCGRRAPRVVSSFAIAGAAPGDESNAAQSEVAGGEPAIPPLARFCWMDDKAAQRFAAYRAGRGAQYDDRQAQAAELRKQRGEPPRKAPPPTRARKREANTRPKSVPADS